MTKASDKILDYHITGFDQIPGEEVLQAISPGNCVEEVII